MHEVNKLTDGNSNGSQRTPPAFLADLPRRNTRAYSFIKIVSRYAFLLVLSFVSGILFCQATAKSFLENGIFFENIAAHFDSVFNGCKSLKSYASVVISASASDIRYLLLIFASGFTYFCGVADSVFIISKGFTVGFSLQYLISLTQKSQTLLQNPKAAVATFALSEIILSLFMVFLASKALIFAYEFRKLRGRKSQIIKSPLIYRYMLLCATAFGLILTINVLSCIASLILQ